MIPPQPYFPILNQPAGRIENKPRRTVYSVKEKEYGQIKKEAGADKIFRLSVFLTHRNQLIFSTPAGPDMNNDLSDLIFCAEESRRIVQAFGIDPKIGIISGGRTGDLGRNETVDRTIEDAEKLQKILAEKKIAATHYTILIEEAVKETNILILPDSLSGEMILKTVAGIGEGREIGNILLLKKNGKERAEDNENVPIYIEQLTKKADPKDLEILKEALELSKEI